MSVFNFATQIGITFVKKCCKKADHDTDYEAFWTENIWMEDNFVVQIENEHMQQI